MPAALYRQRYPTQVSELQSPLLLHTLPATPGQQSPSIQDPLQQSVGVASEQTAPSDKHVGFGLQVPFRHLPSPLQGASSVCPAHGPGGGGGGARTHCCPAVQICPSPQQTGLQHVSVQQSTVRLQV